MYMYVPVSIGKILWTCLSLHMHVLVLHEFSILKKVDFVCENYSIQSVGPSYYRGVKPRHFHFS